MGKEVFNCSIVQLAIYGDICLMRDIGGHIHMVCLMYVVKQKCTTANVVIYSEISLFYYQKFFC